MISTTAFSVFLSLISISYPVILGCIKSLHTAAGTPELYWMSISK